ncbi:hypothetical protein GCM10022232_85910 [Streptomyces plumbiresistens]|uniref:Uncharacterized protein n=1 Tax=Streptomyces plumbiresistens TaxID=511811 RepID=A0ABP7TIZ9_9ACTN
MTSAKGKGAAPRRWAGGASDSDDPPRRVMAAVAVAPPAATAATAEPRSSVLLLCKATAYPWIWNVHELFCPLVGIEPWLADGTVTARFAQKARRSAAIQPVLATQALLPCHAGTFDG